MLKRLSQSLFSSKLKHRELLNTPAVRARSDGAPPTAEDIAACRQWLSKFTRDTIPKRLCELSFSRSSGPGGQNVNKYEPEVNCYLLWLTIPQSQL
jgi:hypothetical protein